MRGTAADGGQVVRYDRASKWYVEHPGRMAPRRHISIKEAARLLVEGKVINLPKTGRFASEYRKATKGGS